jgi:hypothetical protein
MTNTTIEIGTRSHGTLRLEDLLPTAIDTAREVGIPEDKLRRALFLFDLLMIADEARMGVDPDVLASAMDAMVDLGDQINYLLPDGLYYGSIEGDGADIGVWPTHAEDCPCDETGVCI